MRNVLKAASFAAVKHQGQVRAGEKKIPYINHPITVAQLVAEADGSEAAVCAALLHDVMEDCGVKDREILDLYPHDVGFGQRVLAIVKELTDPEGMSYEQTAEIQFQRMCSFTSCGYPLYTVDAKNVKVADQVSNMRDLVTTPPCWSGNPADYQEERQYMLAMRRIVQQARATGAPDVLVGAFEEAYQEGWRVYPPTKKELEDFRIGAMYDHAGA